MNLKSKLRLALVAAVVAASLVPVTGCNIIEYEELSLCAGIAPCSFEYPASYENTETLTSLRFTSVDFYNFSPEAEEPTSHLLLYAREVFDDEDNVNRTITLHIEDVSKYPFIYPDFKLIERSPIIIDGIEGERITYSLTLHAGSGYRYFSGKEDEDTPIVHRAVFFERNDIIWQIVMTSYAEVSQNDERIFRHILESLDFLECQNASDYHTLYLRGGLVDLHFEYPFDYANYFIDNYKTSISMLFYRLESRRTPWAELLDTKADSRFEIHAYGANETSVNRVNDAIEEELSHMENVIDDFQLLERSLVSAAGAVGEQIVYSYTLQYTFFFEFGMMLENTPVKGRTIFFERDGNLFEISILSCAELYEEDKAGFEHILETFQILD